MRTLLKVGGAILICLVLLLLTLRITGFEPREHTPGLWLKGDLVTTPVADWSFTDNYQFIKVQTRTWYLLPHSVTTVIMVYKGHPYLLSYYKPGAQYPHGNHWNEYVARDPHVRLKIGNQLFDRTLSHVTDPDVIAGVLQVAVKKYPERAHRFNPETQVFRIMPG